jgi:hypothetical protein
MAAKKILFAIFAEPAFEKVIKASKNTFIE